MIDQELQEHFLLAVLEPDDIGQKLRVEVEGFFARHGVHADDGVEGINGIGSDGSSGGARIADHLLRGVVGLEVLNHGAEGGREALVCFDCVGEDGIATNVGAC